jgi:hypothetical protein
MDSCCLPLDVLLHILHLLPGNDLAWTARQLCKEVSQALNKEHASLVICLEGPELPLGALVWRWRAVGREWSPGEQRDALLISRAAAGDLHQLRLLMRLQGRGDLGWQVLLVRGEQAVVLVGVACSSHTRFRTQGLLMMPAPTPYGLLQGGCLL